MEIHQFYTSLGITLESNQRKVLILVESIVPLLMLILSSSARSSKASSEAH